MSHKFVVWTLISGLALSFPCVSIAQGVNSPVATGELLIRGGSLTIEPEFQQIDPGRPTVVRTRLGDLSPGNAPSGLRVEAELSGPGLAQPLTLATAPGDDFRIPGLHREGSYSLSGIRLVQDGRVLQPATPDTATIEVRRLVVTSITSRPLTRDELLERGIVLDEDSYTAYHYSVGYVTESGIVSFPFDILTGPNGPTLMPPTDSLGALPNVGPHAIPEIRLPSVTSSLFKPTASGGGSPLPSGDISSELSIPGFIIIPNDLAFLNQFFSVILVVQNGALEGTPITLRDVVASLDLQSAALRPAETSPPSIPGEPVGVVDPGPDGELGTGDDLTVIVAQASAHAEWLVEGREPGMHVFNARLQGWLDGLATGDPVPVACDIPGLVVVRDPRFSMTFFHPLTVRTGEDYDFRVVITNTGSSVVNDLTLRLPATSLSGAELVAGQDEAQIVETIAPGDHAMVTWRLSSRRTGRVTASGFNTTTPGLDASFRFEVGVGELGIPLSPESIVLPRDVDDLPSDVVDHSFGLLGLAYSLATAPEGASLTETSGDGSTTPLPSVNRAAVEVRATELAGLSRRHALGEPLYRTIAGLGLAWSGSNRWDPAFDDLRRRSRRGHGIELSMQNALADAIDDLGWDQVALDLEELAITGRPAVLVYAEDAGYEGSARLRIEGGASGFSAIGQPADVGLFERNLPGASMLEVSADAWSGEIATVAVEPNDDDTWAEGGYRIVLEGTTDDGVELEAVVVLPDGSTRRFHADDPLPTRAGSIVTIDIDPETSVARAWIDLSGDGVSESWIDITVEERPAPEPRVIEARFDGVINSISGPAWSRVLLLLSQALDAEALPDVATDDWTVTSDVTLLDTSGDAIRSQRTLHGQLLVGQMDPSLVTLVLDGPLNPHGTLVLDSGAAPLPFVGGRFSDLDAVTLGTRGDLPTGMIRGLVIGSDGQPLPNAEVELYENMLVSVGFDTAVWMPSRSDRTTSDNDGLFLLDAVRVREDLIPAAENTFTLVVRDPIEGHRTVLKARLRRDGEVRFLQVAIAGRGDIVGTLTREDGADLTAPQVWARSLAYPQEGGVAIPDENGNFRISDVPIGGYQLLGLDGDDYVYGSTSIPGAGLEAHVDLRILPMAPPLGRIDGTVLDEASGDPVPGLKVYLIPSGQQGATHLRETGPDGSFVMDNVPPGIVTLKAWNDSVGRWVAAESIEVMADTTTPVTILIREQQTGSVRGRLVKVTSGVVTPLAGAPVGIAAYGLASVTAADGGFQFPDVPLGQGTVIGWDVETGKSASRTFQLLSDGQEAVLDLQIRTAEATLVVTVVDTTGYPVEGADVAIDRFGGPYQERSGLGGEVRFENVGGGRTDILAKLGPSGHARLGLATNVEVSPVGETSAFITLGDFISLNVKTSAHNTGGGTVDNVVQAIGYRKPGIKASGRIGLVPESGSATCEVNDVGVCELSDLPTNAGSLALEADNPFYGHAALYKYLEPEDEGKTLILDFSAPGVVSGRIVDESDPAVPVEGARVELWITTLSSGVLFEQGIETEADGTFLFELVPPGEFSIRVWHEPSDRLTWFKGYISANQVISGLDLTVHGTGAVEGEVAICFEPETLLRASSQVHVTATPLYFPHPFLESGDPPPVQAKSLDAALDADQRATFAFAGLTSATWSIWAKAADHGSDFAEVSIPADGSSVTLDPELCLHPTGSISGTVVSASDGDPVSSAIVQLFQSRASILGPLLILTDATDEAGAFTFPDLPAQRSYFVMAYDPTTATGGQSPILRLCDTHDSGYGTVCSLDVSTTIGLTDRGSLQGHVLDGSGDLVAGALLRLRLSVVTDRDGAIATYRQELIAQTAVDGSFQFDGITGGTLSLEAFDPSSPLYIQELIEVDPGSPSITGFELQFPETSSATVEVLTPDGSAWDGDPPRVAFRQGSSFFREFTQSVFSINHLVVGTPATFDGIVFGDFDIGACSGDACSDATTDDVLRHVLPATLGAIDRVHMPDPPHDLHLELTAVGRASVRAHVEQGGVPIPDAAVKIVGDGFYGHVDLSTATDSDGWTPALDGIGVGSYTVSASSSDGFGNAIGGATTLEITQSDHGQTLDIMVDLEPSTPVSGVVLGANGLPTPAVVTVTESQGSHRSFSAAVSEDGSFTLPAVPSDGIFTVVATALSGPGRYTISGVAIGSDPVDLGTLVLDEVSPWVAAVRPVNGASDVDPSAAIEIDFSERMRHESLTALQLKLRRGTAGVPVTVSLDDLPDPDGDGPRGDFTRATLDHASLASDTTYLVDVLHTVEDLGGRRPAVDMHSAFTTADVMPPELVETSPIDDPDGIHPVGIDVVLRVTFSETLDEVSVTETTVRLLDQSSSEVPIQRLLDRDGFDLIVNPLSALMPDQRYTLEVDGVTDHAGNALANPTVLHFRTRDFDPPTVILMPPAGVTVTGDAWQALELRQLVLAAQVVSNDAVAGVNFSINGVDVGAAQYNETLDQWSRPWTTPIAPATISLAVVAQDVSGNLSDPAAHALEVLADDPPTGTVALGVPASVLPNHLVTYTVDAADDHGLAKIIVHVTGAAQATDTITIGGPAATHNGNFRLPATAPAGSTTTLSVEIVDGIGQTTPLPPVELTTLPDTEPPIVTVVSPDLSTTAHSGSHVDFRFEIEDAVKVQDTTLVVAGEPQQLQGSDSLPGDVFTSIRTLSWTAPYVDDPETIEWVCTTYDAFDHSTEVSGTISVEPFNDPDAPRITFLHPFEGDAVVGGYETFIQVSMADDDPIDTWSLEADGVPVVVDEPVNSTAATRSANWSVPPDISRGQNILLRVSATDFAGNTGYASIEVVVPRGTPYTGSHAIEGPHEGEDLVIVGGNLGYYSISSDLRPRELILANRANLVVVGSNDLTLEADVVIVSDFTSLKADGAGYPRSEAPLVMAPENVVASTGEAGGSHAGLGTIGLSPGLSGETFDGIALPSDLGGAGSNSTTGGPGANGGGLISINASRVTINGTVSATGERLDGPHQGSGAGGTIRIAGQQVQVAGTVSVIGGWSAEPAGAGGGGRISIEYDSLDLRDSAALETTGGTQRSGYSSTHIAGSGILSLHDRVADAWTLVVDQPMWSAGLPARGTLLPSVGTDVIGAVSPDITNPSNLWVEPADPAHLFSNDVVGLRLACSTGEFKIIGQDGRRRILLEGAAGMISAGDDFSGVLRIDRLEARGCAAVVSRDLVEADEIVIDPTASIVSDNAEAPSIDASGVLIFGYAGERKINGPPGTLSDPDGVEIAFAWNTTTGESTALSVQNDGSIFRSAITGSIGDHFVLWVADHHPAQRFSVVDLGAIPPNEAPAISVPLINVKYPENRYLIVGEPGAISDIDRVTVQVRNLATDTTASDYTSYINPDGSFAIYLPPEFASYGDPLSLEATDQNPDPLTTIADIGPMPDLEPPRIYSPVISITTSGREFRVVGRSGAITDDNVGPQVTISNGVGGLVECVEDPATGAFESDALPWPSGTPVFVIVTDIGGNTVQTEFEQLPANSGPPVIDRDFIRPSVSNGVLTYEGTGHCFSMSEMEQNQPSPGSKTVYGEGALTSDDGLSVRLENRSTPGFPAQPATIRPGSMCPGMYYGFEPVASVGAIGDEIVLVAEDDHPEWLAAEEALWHVGMITGNPVVSISAANLLYLGGAYHLSAPADAITSASGPLTLEGRVWRSDGDDWLEIGTIGTTIASGDAVDLLLPAGSAQGDLVVVTATDANGLTTHVRAGNLPAAVTISASFQSSTASVLESTSSIELVVELSSASAATVTVDYSLTAGSADYTTDWTAPSGTSGTLTFDPGVTAQAITVWPVPDSDPEPDETVVATLIGATNAELGSVTTSILTITDDDTIASGEVYRSVRPGMGELLGGTIDFDVVAGTASFASPLPLTVDRGDRLDTTVGDLWITGCVDDFTCDVVTPIGTIPANAENATAQTAWPAFTSLSDAVDPQWHATNGDLVAVDQTVNLLLCATGADTTPVEISGWNTSATNRLRIVAPTAAGQRTGSQRHIGRWTDAAARLEIDGGSCITTFVGNVDLEGLQLYCDYDNEIDSIGIDIQTADPVTIAESLIRLSPEEASAYYKTGISVMGGSTTTVRNTVIWDIADGSQWGHAGILVGDSMSTLLADHVTVIGGMYGINNYAGTATVRNSLVVGATEACFDGSFTSNSEGNLAGDATAPGAPLQSIGAVTVRNPTTGTTADFHLLCDILEQGVTVTSSELDFGEIANVFDHDPQTIARTSSPDPMFVQLEFDVPRSAFATGIATTNGSAYSWSVSTADSASDMANHGDSYFVVANGHTCAAERCWDVANFEPETARVWRLEIDKMDGNNYDHLAEWILHGLNPACEAAVDAGPGDGLDIDSVPRTGPADIGADQARDLEVGFPSQWLDIDEESGAAVVDVILDRPSPVDVEVWYQTVPGSASEGQDFTPQFGRIVIPAGSMSSAMTVPIVADGPGEGDEELFVELLESAGASLGTSWRSVFIKEDPQRPRVSLTTDHLDVVESDGVAILDVQLDRPAIDHTLVWWVVDEHEALPGIDIQSHGGLVEIPIGGTSGTLSIPIVDNTEVEGTEGLRVRLTGLDHVVPGTPTAAWVAITDDDIPSLGFAEATIEASESGGPIAVVIEASGPPPATATVTISVAGGTAVPGTDFAAIAPTTLTIATGETSASVWLEPIDNHLQDGPRTVILELSSPSGAVLGGTNLTTVTLADDDTPAFVDPALFDLDLSGCLPHLTALPGAVTGPGTLDINVWVGSSYGDWYADTFQVASGDGFEIDLGFLQPDSWILVNADHPLSTLGGGAYLDVAAPNTLEIPPAVDLASISVSWDGSLFTITIPPEAIADRMPDLRLQLENYDLGLIVPVTDPCQTGQPETATIAAEDEFQNIDLVACQGDPAIEECTSVSVVD